MKLLQRVLLAGSLVFMIAGVSLITIPASYSAEKRAAAEERKEQGYVASREGEKYHNLIAENQSKARFLYVCMIIAIVIAIILIVYRFLG